MNKNNWFWHSRFMKWVEGMLLDLTNWVWKKRHQPAPVKKEPVVETNKTQNNSTIKITPKKSPAKKTSARKKTDWNVKS